MSFLPIAAIFIPVVGAVTIYFLNEEKNRLISLTAAAAVLLNFLTVLIVMTRVFAGDSLDFSFLDIIGASIVLRADYFSIYFAVLCSFLWILSLLYFIGYMKDNHYNRRFFILFLLNLGIICGLAFSGNFVTLFFFFLLLS